jgi:para-aminobenzoate synthetase component 1
LLSGGSGERARWSYVAADPLATLVVRPGEATDPAAATRAWLGPLSANDPAGPPFQGGLIGLGCYELAARFEALSLARMAGWPDLACGLYASVLAFDHVARKVVAVGRGGDACEAQVRAELALAWLEGETAASRGALTGGLTASSGPAYEDAVADVTGRIEAGEIFQANIARSWRGRLTAGHRPFDLIARLRAASPAPFAAYLRLADRAVVSNSPERFLAVRAEEGGRFTVESRPIKGTRPRGRNGAEDAALAAELTASAKDRAENLMIVDLMRNDLSRVCSQVAAKDLFRIESFANVHHLVSTVTGTMRPGLTGIDAWAAAFPPGSITGAPKIQAMKVIAGLEPPRGPYCGSMFWAGFDGALDSSVLIRTAVFEQDGEGWSVEARAGAGIVADSRPHEEALETEAKIAAIAGALTADAA